MKDFQNELEIVELEERLEMAAADTARCGGVINPK